MSREIKFRVYSDELKEMIYHDKESKYTFDICGDGAPNLYQGYIELYDFDAVVMQFIGLRDKNAAEIYEGDVVADNRNEKYEVVFDDIKLCYSGKCLKTLELFQLNKNNHLTVLGDKYQNPELLK